MEERHIRRRGVPVPFLAQLRKAKGLTQDGLAELSGITKLTISRAENGGYASPRSVQEWARAMKVEPERLTLGKRPKRRTRPDNEPPSVVG